MGLSDVIKNLFSSSDELEYFEDEDTGYIEEDAPKKSFLDIFKKNKNNEQQVNAPIQNPFIRNNPPSQLSGNGIIKSIAPTDFNTASRNIVSDLKQGFILILNLEGSPIELQNRILDFTYGCVCSLGGNLKKISNSIYITGIDVDLSAFASSFSNSVYNNMNGNYDNNNVNSNFNNVFHNQNLNNQTGNDMFNNSPNLNNQNQFPNPQNNAQNFWNNFQNSNQNPKRNQNQNMNPGTYFQNNFQNFNQSNNVNKPNFFKR